MRLQQVNLIKNVKVTCIILDYKILNLSFTCMCARVLIKNLRICRLNTGVWQIIVNKLEYLMSYGSTYRKIMAVFRCRLFWDSM